MDEKPMMIWAAHYLSALVTGLATSPASRLLHRPVEILRIVQYLWALACQR